MVTYRIHLIRHGMAEDPEKKICLGNKSDPALTPEGAEELRELMDTYQYPYAEKVYCSPLLRCRQTADILFPETDFEIMDELTECDLGDFDGKPIAELLENPAFIGWVEGKCPPPNGEKSDEFASRIACAFDDIIHDMSKNHLIETGTNGIMDGVFHQNLPAGADTIHLLAATVAGTHAGSHDEQSSVHCKNLLYP